MLLLSCFLKAQCIEFQSQFITHPLQSLLFTIIISFQLKMGCFLKPVRSPQKNAQVVNRPADGSALVEQIYSRKIVNPYASQMFRSSLVQNQQISRVHCLAKTVGHEPILPEQITMKIIGRTEIELKIEVEGNRSLKQFRQEVGLGKNYNFCQKGPNKTIESKAQSKIKLIDIVQIKRKNQHEEFTIFVRPHLVNFKDGLYEGQLKTTIRQGFGIQYYNNGSVYEGFWKEDMKHGEGKLLTKNGDTYVGKWKQNNKHGKGIYTFKNNDKFIGEYKMNQRHGKGIMKLSNGKILKETYFQGQKLDSEEIHGEIESEKKQ